MSTALLEERLLDYKNKENKNLSLDEIFVSYYLGTENGVEIKTKKLSELFVKEKTKNKTIIRPLKSYDELIKYSSSDSVFVESSGIQLLPKNGNVVLQGKNYVNRTDPFYASFNVDENYETTDSVETTVENTSNASSNFAVPYGLSKTMSVLENDLSADNNYLMLSFDGSSKQDFVKKSSIYFIEGGQIVYLYQNNKKIDFDRVKGKTLYVGNQIVDKLYTEKEYKFGHYQKFESFNGENLTKGLYVLIENPTDEQKAQVKTGEVIEIDGLYYYKDKETAYDKSYSTLEPVTLSVPDPNKPGKTKNQDYYAVKIYQIDNAGDYLNLKIKGDNKGSMVELSKLFDASGTIIDKSNILNYVGKPIKVKTSDNRTAETEPLTFEQANFFYRKEYNYEPSISKNDVLAENSFLVTAKGKFVPEKNVAPMSYNFTDKENCDAYLVKVETENGIVEQLVSANDFAKKTKNLNLKGVYKLETASFSDAKIIQVTNTGKGLEDCRILGNYNQEKDIYENLEQEDDKAVRKDILSDFKNKYIDGIYSVDHIYQDGEKVELDPRQKRYVYSDTHYMKDYAADTLMYGGLKNSNVTYESENGELGKFKGNAKLSFGKTCKKAYSIWGKSLLYYLGINMTGLGLFACLVAPAVVVAAAGALIAAPVVIPVVAGIACFIKNVLNRPFKDKTKFNRKKWNKDIEKELVAINEDMKETDFSKGLSKETLIARMNKLKADVLAGSQSTVGDGFQMIDGTIVVTGDNVNQVKKFKKTHKKELNNIKVRKNQVEKAKKIYEKLYKPFKEQEEKGAILNTNSKKYQEYIEAKQAYEDLQGLYNNEESRFNRMLSNHKGEALTYNKDAKVDQNLKRVERLKNFWLVKKFTSKEELLANGFSEEEVKQIETLEYDPTKDLFITKDGEYVADTVKPKVQIAPEEYIVPEENKETVDLLTKLKNLMDKQDKPQEVSVPVVEEIKPQEVPISKPEEQVKPSSDKPKKKNYDTRIVSEDVLVKFLKSKPEHKERQKLISYISKIVGEEITEKDIQATIKRIDSKHNPKKGESKSATAGATSLKNQNIYNILTYGQQYLTEYAQEIKKRTSKPEHNLGR